MTAPLIVVLASTAYDGHQLYDQRLAGALASYGRVLYVDPPRALGRRTPPAQRGPDPALEVEVVQPTMLPFGRRRLLYPLTALAIGVWARRQITSRTTRGTPVYLVVIAAPAPTLRALPRARNVHLIKDDYVAGAALIDIDPALIARRFSARMTTADEVCVVSPHLRDVLIRRGVRSTVVPAGCIPVDEDHPEPADLGPVSTPRAVFIGMISDRIDFTILSALTAGGVSVVIVGPMQNTFTKHAALRELLSHSGFHHLEPRTGGDLWAVLQHCDVGLIPYEQSEFNDSSFPLKAFEYLAAGLQIVSTPLPAMSWLGHEVIHIESGVEGFVRATVNACETRDDWATRCREIAAENSWDHRAATFAELLGLSA